MLNRFANWIVPKLAARCERRKRIFKITGTAGPDDVYLIRYFLFTSKHFSIYIHRFLRSDRDDPHDHPFDFLSYIVKGGYLERRYDPMSHPGIAAVAGMMFCPYADRREQGSWAFRPAETVHSVHLDKEYTLAEAADAPLTVIFLSGQKRKWGFWKEDEKNSLRRRWVKWTEYLNVPESSEREA